jgi:hypothetical protein
VVGRRRYGLFTGNIMGEGGVERRWSGLRRGGASQGIGARLASRTRSRSGSVVGFCDGGWIFNGLVRWVRAASGCGTVLV